ncbi:MAG: nicotinate-nucleotide--dimethylbenzimidazole phosphoribosyltransferase, partial [Clostridiales bacterium]|nr:nicotinate-nucleotide--dimethylbenzimidazole phosphoribosyltransferase [Clostridiales bacterium]
GSLGRLEELSVQLAGITGKVHNELPRKQLLVFAADNGVVAEGVSSAPQSVTMQQTINLTRGKTGAAVLAKRFDCGLTVCDVGVNADICESAVLNRKIAYGTQNICAGPAMTREQALQAILTGAAVAEDVDADAVGIGEMGIGNTTTSSAVLCALSGESVEAVTGRGGGLTDAAFCRKKQVIEQALAVNRPDTDDPIDVLCKVGGFDLCAMTGVFLGAAHARLPVVVDGFISIVAALCAARLCENARGFFFGSHVSYERGYKVAEQLLGLQPCLQLGMRLGEGSGCPLAFRVIEAACAVISTMATFPEAAIDDTYLTEIREKDSFTV